MKYTNIYSYIIQKKLKIDHSYCIKINTTKRKYNEMDRQVLNLERIIQHQRIEIRQKAVKIDNMGKIVKNQRTQISNQNVKINKLPIILFLLFLLFLFFILLIVFYQTNRTNR